MTEKSKISKSLYGATETVKINFNEMDKSELLQMLAFMQSELEAREIVIATLKSEKCKQLLCQAKYGRLNTPLVTSKVNSVLSNDNNWIISNDETLFSMSDPFSAMQRDNQCITSGTNQNADSSIESNLKPVYESQLNQLENLISSQKKAQMKMKEQIVYLEKKCLKLTQALEDERNKHERDAAQGDDVLVMLEKERERLKSELEFEKSHSRKLERELKRTTAVIEDQKTLIQNQRLAASVILKIKKQLENDLKSYDQIICKSSNNSSELSNVDSPRNHQHSVEHALNNHTGKVNPDNRYFGTGEGKKCNQNLKSPRNDSSSSGHIHGTKLSHHKESIATSIQNPTTDNIDNQISTKTRTNKQPESLLWKTYDSKNNLSQSSSSSSSPLLSSSSPFSNHSGSQSTVTKSPCNTRRQLPNISMFNSVPIQPNESNIFYNKHLSAVAALPVASSIPTTITVPVTISPYQKILSTPPNQSNTYQTSLTSYGLFNVHSSLVSSSSSSLQNVAPPCPQSHFHPSSPALGGGSTLFKPSMNYSKSETLLMTTINNAAHIRMSVVVTSVSNIPSTAVPSNSPLLRSADCSPGIPKHVYVNGK